MPKKIIPEIKTGWTAENYFSPVILKDTEDFLRNFVSQLKENTQLLAKMEKLKQRLGSIWDKIRQANEMGAEGKKYLNILHGERVKIQGYINKETAEIYHALNEYLNVEAEKNAGARFVKMALDKIGHTGNSYELKRGLAANCYKIVCGQQTIKNEALNISKITKQHLGINGYNEVAYDLYQWKQSMASKPAASPTRKKAAKGLQSLEDTSYGKASASEAPKPAGGKKAKVKARKPSGGAREHEPGAKAKGESNLRGARQRRPSRNIRWGRKMFEWEIKK